MYKQPKNWSSIEYDLMYHTGVRRYNGTTFVSEFENENVNNYIRVKTLGSGSFGEVALYQHIANPSKKIAIKVVKKEYILKQRNANDPNAFHVNIPNDVYISNVFEHLLPYGILDAYVAKNARLENVTHNRTKTFLWRDYVNPNDAKKLHLKQLLDDLQEPNIGSFKMYFDIIMDNCEGTLKKLESNFKTNPFMSYTMLKDIVYQLSIVYNATKLIYTDMKSINVLYKKSNPYEYIICDMGSFSLDGERSPSTYVCPFGPDGVDLVNIHKNAHVGYGIWSLHILLSRTCKDTTPSIRDCPNINVIFNKLRNNLYANPYVESMNDFLTMVAHPILFNVRTTIDPLQKFNSIMNRTFTQYDQIHTLKVENTSIMNQLNDVNMTLFTHIILIQFSNLQNIPNDLQWLSSLLSVRHAFPVEIIIEQCQNVPNVLGSAASPINVHIMDTDFLPIPEWMYTSPSLHALHIKNNRLMHTISPRFQELPNVTTLEFSEMDIVRVPSELFAMPKLRYLIVSKNVIQYLPSNPPPNGCNLEELSIDKNDLRQLPQWLAQSRIESIIATHNPDLVLDDAFIPLLRDDKLEVDQDVKDKVINSTRMSHPMLEPMPEPMQEPMDEPILEPMPEPMHEPMQEPMDVPLEPMNVPQRAPRERSKIYKAIIHFPGVAQTLVIHNILINSRQQISKTGAISIKRQLFINNECTCIIIQNDVEYKVRNVKIINLVEEERKPVASLRLEEQVYINGIFHSIVDKEIVVPKKRAAPGDEDLIIIDGDEDATKRVRIQSVHHWYMNGV
jgi:hypothetical protein